MKRQREIALVFFMRSERSSLVRVGFFASVLFANGVAVNAREIPY